MTYKIYAKQIDEEKYILVNENGNNVSPLGELTYHPCIYRGKAERSPYPVYEVK